MPLTEKQARKKVEAIEGFYRHLLSYVLVIGMLAGINLLTSPGDLWFIFPLLGWGVGLASHGLSVFGVPGVGAEWRERKVRELMEEAHAESQIEAVRREIRRLERGEARAPDYDGLLDRIADLEARLEARDGPAPAGAPPEPLIDLEDPADPYRADEPTSPRRRTRRSR